MPSIKSYILGISFFVLGLLGLNSQESKAQYISRDSLVTDLRVGHGIDYIPYSEDCIWIQPPPPQQPFEICCYPEFYTDRNRTPRLAGHIRASWILDPGYCLSSEDSTYFHDRVNYPEFYTEWFRVPESIPESNYDSIKSDIVNTLIPSSTEFPNIVSLDYYLFQNYPNPFNTITTIPYNLPQGVNGSLRVFNTQGQTVTNTPVFYNQRNVTFDALELSSGVYFYRIETSNYNTPTKKMVLLK